MNQGTVKFFDKIKGYGFIKNEDETKEDMFVHKSALNGLEALEEGQKVTYEVETNPRNNKPNAANVTVVEEM